MTDVVSDKEEKYPNGCLGGYVPKQGDVVRIRNKFTLVETDLEAKFIQNLNPEEVGLSLERIKQRGISNG